MTGHERETAALIAGLVKPHGLTCKVQIGGKHLGVIVAGRGLRHKFTVSSSPRSASSQLNHTRQQVNAWLDATGLGSGRGEKGEKRRAHHRTRTRSTTYRIEVAIDPETGPARDPWACLKSLAA